MVFSLFGFPHKNTCVPCMCMIVHLFIVYLLCKYWMIMIHWYNTFIIWLKRIRFLYYWSIPPLSNPTIGIREGSFRNQFNQWKVDHVEKHLVKRWNTVVWWTKVCFLEHKDEDIYIGTWISSVEINCRWIHNTSGSTKKW